MTPSSFIGALFQSRDMMHIAHLQTTSYAEHKALDGYYSGILEFADTFTETYFGRNKRIEITIPESKNTDAITHLKDMQKMVESEIPNYPPDLQNILQDTLGLINHTLYLLSLT